MQFCFFQLRQLKSIRRCLSKSNLAGQLSCLLDRHQCVLNAAARLYAGVPRNSHVTAILMDDLNWLCISQRINFKLCFLLGEAPANLSEHCFRLSDCATRAACSRPAALGNLVLPRSRTKAYGQRYFRVCGPSSWNALSTHLKQDLPYVLFK